MGSPLLQIRDLHVAIGEHQVLDGVDLTIAYGETHVLFGPNGGGKTTLLNTILGMPGYDVTQGSITFKGQDLLALTIDERARLGIGIAFQKPPAVRGIKLRQMLESAAGARGLEEIQDVIESLNVDYMLDRDVNLGFSGGEAKRSEMAQLVAQRPDLALFDEPESGVDLENIAVVGKAIAGLLKGERAVDPRRSGLIITHTGYILDYVNADQGHILFDGRIACHGNPRDLVEEIADHGFEKCLGCDKCHV